MQWFMSLLICLGVILISFKSDKIKQLVLHGKPVAKTIMWVSYDLPGLSSNSKITWSVSETRNGKWKELPGINSREIVLLSSYLGQYIKCEISLPNINDNLESLIAITDSPVISQGNPNTDWLKDAGIGVMLHFLQAVYAKDGSAKEWNEVTDGFNVEIFAENCKEAGANYVMFALGQNDGYYCSPNRAYDSITGVAPGELCSIRDLPADLFEALDKRGIKMMFYLPGNPPINNKLVSDKFQYTYGKDSPTSQFTQTCWEAVIREWSLRYGKKLSGWWFDGMYRGGIIETRSDMNLPHNISTHTLAAKSGNHNSIVTYNYGVNKIQSNSPYDDFSAGEEGEIVQIPQSRWVVEGVQWFIFTYLGSSWSKDGTRFKTPQLEQWAEKIFKKKGVICFDINVDKTGLVNPEHIAQVKAIRETFERVKKRNR